MTSLSAQLKKLAVPQTSGLVDLKKRASILFDPKDAATKDRKTIFDLGCQGLAELIALNHAFAQFEDTLFQHTSLHLERSVEDSSFNKQLDKNIKKFFIHLSPYFMLRSAHMCLEWLIRRFQVHAYNTDAVMGLILPYHETNIFVKCIQILKIKFPSNPWNWLHGIQKPGVTLAKSAIINRASNDPNFLSFVCKNVIDATKELGPRASTLQCLINFYCSVVVGALDSNREIKEWHITTILPSLLRGMKSTAVDFVSASFMITSQLVSKTKFTPKLLNVLVSQIWKVNCENLQASMILLLSWIAKTQTDVLSRFPHEGFADFVSNKWLTATISGLSREGISIHYVVVPFIQTAIDMIQENGNDAKACKQFLENLFYEVQLQTYTAKIVIRSVLETSSFGDTDNKQKMEEVIIDLESDSEMPTAENIQNWYSKILQLLERQYPTELDAIIKEAMQSDKGDASQNAIKVALASRYKFLDADTSSIFQNLYHVNPKIRVLSVREIVKHINESNNDARNYNLLKETLADRIKDDNEQVIEEILKLPTEVFLKILGCKSFVESLIAIIDKANMDPANWGKLQSAALTHITSDDIVQAYDNNLILLSIMLYLFPVHNDEKSAQYIKQILQSPFAENMPFLHNAVQKYKNKNINPIDFKKDFLNAVALSDAAPRAESLVESIQNNGHNYFKSAFHTSHFLMMVTACFKVNNPPEKSHNLLKFTITQCSRFKISQFSNDQWMSATKSNSIPLQLYMDFLHSLVRGTDFRNLLDWESENQSFELFLEIFKLLTSNAFSSQPEQNEKREWAKCLRDILNIVFPTPKSKLSFLSQFFFYENVSNIENFAELRIRSIKLIELILKGESKGLRLDLKFVLKVIVALNSRLSTIRGCALGMMQQVKAVITDKETISFVEKILERSEEIQCDAEQIPLILYSLLASKNKKDNGFVMKILSVIENPKESIVFKSKVLEILKHIKDINILRAMLPIALSSLKNVSMEGSISILDMPAASLFKSVMKRFDENCLHEIIVTDKEAWQLIEDSLKMTNTFTKYMNEKFTPVPCITLQVFDEVTYNQLPSDYKGKFLKLIIETISLSDDDVLFLDINKALRRCCLDCKHALPLLESMKNICGNMKAEQKKRILSKDATDDISVTNTRQWKEGVILLEILENKKRLQNSYVLIPMLFDILKKCLDMENQAPLEYTKQLILSALLQSCQRANADLNINQDMPKNVFKMDLIVQCIRVTQNPQTHYNALLLLSHCALLFPQQVLHNLVDIFTFMGSSIARHDDAFSFQIISNIVESIIPILVKEKNSTEAAPVNNLVIPVLKIFSDILLDVPEHRRVPLYTKLLNTLGAEQYFWLFLCVVFESHVINEEKNKISGKKNNERTANTYSTEKLPKRIAVTLQLLHKFSTTISLQTCISLMGYVKSLPMSKEEVTSTTKVYLGKTLDSQDFELFDVKARSAKQFRHYKYLILQFVSTFTSSPEFLKAITALDENDNKSIKTLYQQFIIKTLSYIPDVTSALERSSMETSQLKFWKVILHHCYDALDNVIFLLSPDMFLVVVHGLMHHQLITIRKKVIELLISKLQLKNDYFENCNEENILNLLRSLCEIISTIPIKDRTDNSVATPSTAHHTNETIFVQQAALIAVKLLSRLFALKHIEEFKNIVVVLTSVTKKRTRISKIILATVILTLVEVTSNLKAHSISHLPKFMPHLIDALNDQTSILQKQPPDNVCLALITGIQKLFEAMPLFLGPYIVGVITALSKIWSRIQANGAEQEQRTTANINKLQLIWSKIASEVPARVLIPNCERAYYVLMEDQSYSSISFLMKLFLECVSNSSNQDLLAVQVELTNFFLKSLEFRSQVSSSDANITAAEEISQTEIEIINAFVAWILKLSESSFRPVYKKIYDWTFHSKGPKERVLTYFILNRRISTSLKSLFVLFAAEFIQDAAELLTNCNTSKSKALYFANCDELNSELVKNILCTLTSIFLHDSKGFANPHRFDILMQPIVDQLENKLIQDNEELQEILSSCIGQLGVAVSSDVLWKQLNYQILLKTRTNVPQIRIIAFNCCVELARKLGDDFTSLLPETIPFVAELFEDEHPQVVKSSKKAVQELETILGESLQKYL